MAGSRGASWRGGDLAEGFGLELLRPFAFVAPIPRPEDVGVDAVATLFSRVGRGLIAEDSFLVQVKAASARTIEFKATSLDWIRALRLPYYLISVDLATSTVDLHSTIHATGHANFRDLKSVTMHLDETPFSLVDWEMHVFLGAPILRWKPADCADKAFQQTAYDVIKAWITFETESIALRSIGITRQMKWKTNDKPVADSAYSIMHNPGDLQPILEKIRPHIQRLSAFVTPSDRNDEDLLFGLLLVSQFMRRQGVDPDPNGILGMFADLRAKATQSAPQG